MRYARMYANGCCFDMGSPMVNVKRKREHKGGGKRSALTGRFSAASFRRLREFCVTHDCDGECWGITLTIPGDIVGHDFVHGAVHNLSVFCNDRSIPCIWRIELQQRGQPHLHLVCYCTAYQAVMVLLEWQRLMIKSGSCYSVEQVGKDCKDLVLCNRMFVNGSSHAFHLEKLSGDFRSWRYLVAHQSKGKQKQQGWVGRQWGIVNRKLISVVAAFEVELDDRRAFALRRWVRRLTRRRIAMHGKHFLLLNPETMRKMVSYLQEDDYFLTPF